MSGKKCRTQFTYKCIVRICKSGIPVLYMLLPLDCTTLCNLSHWCMVCTFCLPMQHASIKARHKFRDVSGLIVLIIKLIPGFVYMTGYSPMRQCTWSWWPRSQGCRLTLLNLSWISAIVTDIRYKLLIQTVKCVNSSITLLRDDDKLPTRLLCS